MRKFEERNFAAPELCVTAKVTHETCEAEYSECLLREDLPKDKIGVYIIIPIERLAVDSILDIKGININSPEYQEHYIETADDILRLSNDEIKERFDKPNASEKEKEIAKIICNYQKALKERGLDFPEPFSDIPLKKANSKKYANEFEKTLDELLANQPIVDLTAKDKEILPEPAIKSDNKPKSDKILEKFQDIKSGKFPEFPKFTSETSPKTDIVGEKKSESIEEITKEPANAIVSEPEEKADVEEQENIVTELLENPIPADDLIAPVTNVKESAVPAVKKEEPSVAKEKSQTKKDGFNIDFNLALTADELFGDDEDEVVIPVEEDSETKSDNVKEIPDISVEQIKKSEAIKEETVIKEKESTESKKEASNAFPEISDLDDDDIYKDLFGANSNF